MASALPEGDVEALQKMLLGVQAYQAHPYARQKPDLNIIWQQGSVTVGTLAPFKKGQPVLLLVPSMVNRAYIMDLMPERSLLRWLEGQGINACLLDWGNPVDDGDMSDLDAAIGRRLVPSIRFLAQQNKVPVHVLGYCMGGTILASAAEDAAEDIASLIFLAAPWDFHAGTQALLNRVKFWAPSAAPMIAAKGFLPMDWMQTVFASLHPGNAAQKFTDFAVMDQQSSAAKMFVAVEDWLNDGVDLPAAIAQQPINEWFLQNKPGQGEWGDVSAIKAPSLIITSRRDRLVDYETAAALHKEIEGSKLIDSGCGHIGMMAGRDAVEKVWTPIAEWVKKHQ